MRDIWIEMKALYNLARMIKELRLYEKVAKELNIKASSVRRQLDRLIAFYEGREVQKRSGRRKGAEYEKKMWELLERVLGRKINPFCFGQPRVRFDRLEDALRYTQPIPHISGIAYDWENSVWVVCIPKDSSIISPYEE